jgi:translation initiation factor IF-3
MMPNDSPNWMERGYLLPIGCKDLIDAIRLHPKQKTAPWGIKTNDSIKAPRLRVLRFNGEEVGILPLAEALELAQSLEVDLVELKPKADPPICMLVDYAELIRLMSRERENPQHG